MLTYFLSPKEVALYSNSFSLILSLISFFGLYSIILQPIFTELYELKNIKKLTIIFQKLYSLFIYILFPFLFLFFYFSEQIMSFIFGSNYLGGSLVLSLYSLFLIFPIINSYNISFINGLNLVKYLPKIIFFIVFLNFFLNLFLIPKFGIIGPVISTIIGWIIFFLFTLKIISNFINISIKRINFLKLFFNVIIFLILVYFLKGFQFFDNYYMNSLFILSISFLFYYLFGNFIGIYRIKDFYILIPEGVLKSKFEKYHKKYFPFLK
jgi:O-antigen/teichoic acid export membrane protein